MSRTPCSSSFCGIGTAPHSGIPGRADRAAAAQDEDRVGGDLELGVVDPGDEVVDPVEDERRAAVDEQVRVGGAGLDHGAARGERAAHDGEPLGRLHRARRGSGSRRGPRSAARPRGSRRPCAPVIVSASSASSGSSSFISAGTPPAWKSCSTRCLPEGRTSASSGMRRESSSKRSRSSGTPQRPASASRWITALVEPPTASRTVIALSKAAAVRICEGRTDLRRQLDRAASDRVGDLVAARIDRRRRRGPGQRHPQPLDHRGQGRCRPHLRAVPRRGPRGGLELVVLVARSSARRGGRRCIPRGRCRRRSPCRGRPPASPGRRSA